MEDIFYILGSKLQS